MIESKARNKVTSANKKRNSFQELLKKSQGNETDEKPKIKAMTKKITSKSCRAARLFSCCISSCAHD